MCICETRQFSSPYDTPFPLHRRLRTVATARFCFDAARQSSAAEDKPYAECGAEGKTGRNLGLSGYLGFRWLAAGAWRWRWRFFCFGCAMVGELYGGCLGERVRECAGEL
jgi:hypothetical protein